MKEHEQQPIYLESMIVTGIDAAFERNSEIAGNLFSVVGEKVIPEQVLVGDVTHVLTEIEAEVIITRAYLPEVGKVATVTIREVGRPILADAILISSQFGPCFQTDGRKPTARELEEVAACVVQAKWSRYYSVREANDLHRQQNR